MNIFLQKTSSLKFDVLVGVTKRNTLLWDGTPCS